MVRRKPGGHRLGPNCARGTPCDSRRRSMRSVLSLTHRVLRADHPSTIFAARPTHGDRLPDSVDAAPASFAPTGGDQERPVQLYERRARAPVRYCGGAWSLWRAGGMGWCRQGAQGEAARWEILTPAQLNPSRFATADESDRRSVLPRVQPPGAAIARSMDRRRRLSPALVHLPMGPELVPHLAPRRPAHLVLPRPVRVGVRAGRDARQVERGGGPGVAKGGEEVWVGELGTGEREGEGTVGPAVSGAVDECARSEDHWVRRVDGRGEWCGGARGLSPRGSRVCVVSY